MLRWIVIAALIASCKKGTHATPAAAEQDALWKLAPMTASRGVVISSQGMRALESAWRELDRQLAGPPELVAVGEVLRHQVPTLFPTGGVSLARAGMTAERGAAFFFSRSGARVMFLPVTDRAAFLAFVHGTADEDGDHVGDLTCRTVGDRYACANPVQLLTRLGKGTLVDQIQLVGERGDVEVAIEETDPRARVGMVARFERGSVVVRGAIREAKMRSQIVNASAQRFDTSKLAGFGVLNVGAALASLPIPREPLAGGFTLADLIGNMAGPVILSLPAGSQQGEVRVPMKNPTMARELVTHCEDIEHLAILSSSFRDDVCHLTVPGLSLDFDVSLEGSELRARIVKPAGAPHTLRPSAIANELAHGEWAYAVYGRGLVLGSFQRAGEEVSATRVIGLRVLSWVNEGGVGVRTDGDLVRFYAAIRTVWSNPDDVVAKWLALPIEQILEPATIETARQIAMAAPTAPLADDVHAGTAVLAPIATLAMLAGLSAPTFFDKRDLRDLTAGGGAPSTAEEGLQRLAGFKDAICACRDVACAKQVSDEMTAWSIAQSRAGRPPDLDAEQRTKADAIAQEMASCLKAAFERSGNAHAGDYITKNLEFKDRVCACKDLACGEAVSRELTAWSEAFLKNLPQGTTMSAADDRRMQKIEREVRACMDALRRGAN